MQKSIWILNHHATGMASQHGGRHYNFAQHLIKSGYDVKIFCASEGHNNQQNKIILGNRKYIQQDVDGIPFIFVKTRNYKGNGLKRILGMFDYYFNVKKVAKKFPNPDTIIGSSVHPLACVAAIKLSRKYTCQNIVEIRDLWPESIVEFLHKSKKNPLIILLYHLEKWIYVNAHKLIFTIEGGYDYIVNKGWDDKVSKQKVYHINNGVDLEKFFTNRKSYQIQNKILSNQSFFKVIYTGSIRKANNLDLLLNAAKIVGHEEPKIQFLVFGDGDYKEILVQRCNSEEISNIHFFNRVEKKYIPYILSMANCNVLNYQEAETWKYGGSQNKLFEYLASGKPIVSNIRIGYSLIDRYGCGISAENNTAQAYADAILRVFSSNPTEYKRMCENAEKAASFYDFSILTEKLMSIIEV